MDGGGDRRRRDVRSVIESGGVGTVGDPYLFIMTLIILLVSFMLSKRVVTFLIRSQGGAYVYKDTV